MDTPLSGECRARENLRANREGLLLKTETCLRCFASCALVLNSQLNEAMSLVKVIWWRVFNTVLADNVQTVGSYRQNRENPIKNLDVKAASIA